MEKNLAFVIILTMYHNTEKHLIFVACFTQLISMSILVFESRFIKQKHHYIGSHHAFVVCQTQLLVSQYWEVSFIRGLLVASIISLRCSLHPRFLLEKGWPLGSRLWCLTVSLSLSHWYHGPGVVLNCIDSWSSHPYLLYLTQVSQHWDVACICG